MIMLKFFYVASSLPKLPVLPVRKEQAFVKADLPNVFGFFVKKEKDWERKPNKELWSGFKLKPTALKMLTYPDIDPNDWYTYRKVNDKIKRVTLADHIRKGG